MDKNIDVLIVGGGICGRLAQLELEKRGQRTLVIDAPGSNHCTAVAAGLANPIIGKYFTVGWRVDEFFVDLAGYYGALEKRLTTSFFTPKPLKRIIASAGEQNTWLSKSHLDKYVGFCSFSHETIEGLHTSFGVLDVARGGEMRTRDFLKACNEQLPTLAATYTDELLDLENKQYAGVPFQQIIFAEGHRVMQNPLWHKQIKIVPNKGEILEIKTELPAGGYIVLGPIFLQHLADDRWRVGATYEAGETILEPTSAKKEELQDRLEKILAVPYTVVDHYCGVRPTTPDRKPAIGVHPQYDFMYLLNGMGSKAVSMAPTLVGELIDAMLLGSALHEDVALQRFEKWV